MMINFDSVKKDFRIFDNNEGLVYLDSAATSQVPNKVIEAIRNYKEKNNANTSRGVYNLSEKSSEEYDNSRETVARFIGARKDEIVFTKNTTDSINILSNILKEIIPENKNEIVLTEMEHHSNLIPWQIFAKNNNMKLNFIKVKNNFTLDMDDAKEKINDKTAIVSVTHVSNVLGTVNPIEKIVELAKSKSAISIVDSAQGVPHIGTDVKKINCDFLVFSSHKMMGPMGVGILYGKKELLEKLNPASFGGGIVKNVTFDSAEFIESPAKFEAGTQNIEGVIGLKAAIEYLENLGIDNIEKHEKELLEYALEKIKKIDGIEIYNPGEEYSSGIISFNIEGIHPHDVASILNQYKIAIRAGHCCAIPLMKKLGINGVCRISFYIYNNKDDINKFIEALEEVREKFK